MLPISNHVMQGNSVNLSEPQYPISQVEVIAIININRVLTNFWVLLSFLTLERMNASILQMRKMKPREVKKLGQVPSAKVGKKLSSRV